MVVRTPEYANQIGTSPHPMTDPIQATNAPRPPGASRRTISVISAVRVLSRGPELNYLATSRIPSPNHGRVAITAPIASLPAATAPGTQFRMVSPEFEGRGCGDE